MQRMKTSIAVNFIYNMMYQISLVILPLITSPYLSRVIGPESIGNYSYSYSVAHYFYLFGMLGISNYGNRSISAIRENQAMVNHTFSRIYYFQVIVSGISTIAYLFYCICICNANVSLALAQVFYVLSSTLSVNWFFFGLEEFRVTVIRKIAIKLITTLCIFVFIKSPEQLLVYTLIIAGAELLGEVYLWFYIPHYVKLVKVRIRDIFIGSKEIIILFFPIIATSVYRYMDKIMLGQLDGMIDVGQYDYAEKILMICLGCMTALGTVMLPKMANLVANKKDSEVKRYLDNSMQFAMLMGSAIAFGLGSVGKRLALVYFGENFGSCGMAIEFLAITVLPIAWANVLRNQYLIPSAKDKEYLLSVIIGAILNFSVNLVLIPKFGLSGAIVGTILAEYSVAIIQTIQVSKDINIHRYLISSISFLLIGMIMYIPVKLVALVTQDNLWGLLIQIILGGSIYIVVSLLYCRKKKNFIWNAVDRLICRRK